MIDGGEDATSELGTAAIVSFFFGFRLNSFSHSLLRSSLHFLYVLATDSGFWFVFSFFLFPLPLLLLAFALSFFPTLPYLLTHTLVSLLPHDATLSFVEIETSEAKDEETKRETRAESVL